ncbi:ester cyclase [Paenibacillus sp. GSMTC-2017]|uniref:ester cyclase n=1 Tax=Paenibacillus sp. GSMTC-2017 TaxID=2794350 RepID=UPI0018DA29CF|nr:ester cyclase [Paenibacillus sp. GSMTC-2017]MBH5317574.1 ester cyclase [Paenibacillus sp. GSMTC-2017]
MNTIEQKNIEIVTAFIEAFWNQNNLDSADHYLSSDYQEHSYQSKEGLKHFAEKILEAFPDKSYTIEEMVAQEEKVIVRMVVKGTHRGMFFGKAGTGNSIDVTLYRQYRVKDGKISEHRGWIDMMTMWRQIGTSHQM